MKTWRQKFLAVFGLPSDTSLGLDEIAELTDLPINALQEVYNRGVGAWKGNIGSVRVKGSFKKDPLVPRSGKLGREQWGYGRVYSFIMGGKTQQTTDKDIIEKYSLRVVPMAKLK
jgi:hypothetical protein